MNYSSMNQLEDSSSVSRRKSSWSNYLQRPEEEPDRSENSGHPRIKKLSLPTHQPQQQQQVYSRYQYNIEDFLPKPNKNATYASVDIVELDD
jgi:hypothetical protein